MPQAPKKAQEQAGDNGILAGLHSIQRISSPAELLQPNTDEQDGYGRDKQQFSK